MLNYIVTSLKGTQQARAAHKQALREKPGILLGLRQLHDRIPVDLSDDKEEPIFFFQRDGVPDRLCYNA